jgi:putative heme-binding domain-containing protein
VRKLNDLSLDSLTNSQLITALYIYQLCSANKGQLDDSVLQVAINRLDAIYPHDSAEVNRYLSLLLGEQDSPNVVSKTIPLLAAAIDQAEQLHYLFAIRKVRTGWTPSLRQGYVDGLRRSATYLGGEGMPGFLKQIRNDFLAAMSDKEREQFTPLIEPKSLADTEPLPQRPFVRKWTMDDLQDLSSAAGGKREFERGRQLFAAALCARCHRVGNHGQLAGPDLTGVSRRFTRRDILRSIVEPSLVVAENYHVDRIETTDGRILIGRIVQSGDFRSPSLRVVSDPLRPDQFTEVVKRDIETHSTVPTSPMPAGLLDTLTKDEIADLLAFIESGGSMAEKGAN